MWDHDEYEEAKAHYMLSGLVLIYLGVVKIIVALLALYFGMQSIIMDPVTLSLLGMILLALGFWMRSEDAL